MSQTGWLMSNRDVLLTVLEAGSLRPGCRHRQVVHHRNPAPSQVEETRELRGRLIRALTHLPGLHPHDLVTAQRPCPLIPSPFEGRISTCGFGGYTQMRAETRGQTARLATRKMERFSLKASNNGRFISLNQIFMTSGHPVKKSDNCPLIMRNIYVRNTKEVSYRTYHTHRHTHTPIFSPLNFSRIQ